MPNSNDDLENRLKKLSDKLEIQNPDNNENQPTDKSGVSFAFRISTEIIAGIVIGGFLGYYTDEFFQTKPLFLIIFLLLGVAGSFLNIYRNIKNV